MTSSALGQSLPLISDLEPGMGKSAAMLGLSAGLEGAEMELQKMLIDERMKSETHRTNYQTLKAEHASLQEEFMRVQGELRRLMSDKQIQQEKFQLRLTELQDEVLFKTGKLEDLQRQVMTPQRLELLRADVQQEMEAPVRERFNKLEEETEKYRSEYYKLRYQNNVLKSQLEHQIQQSAFILEEKRIRYEAELCSLEKDREELMAQYQGSDVLRDGKRIETLLGERAQLHLRVRSLEAEVAELRAQNESLGQQAESDLRLQTRQLSEAQAVLKTIEVERQALRQELERMESELQLSREQNSQLTGKLHKAEREVNSLTCHIDSVKHSHKQETASVRLESTRMKEELDRERGAFQNHVEGLQAEIEVLKTTMERHKDVVVEKERELVRKVQSAREEGLLATATLHEEKLKLETRVAELEQQRVQENASGSTQQEEWEERLRKAQQGEESARRELQHLRNKLHQQSFQLDELDRLKTEMTELQLRNQEVVVQLGTLSHSESDLMESNQHLRKTLDRVKEEMRMTQTQAEKSQHEAERLLEERRIEWQEEKRKLQEHDAELQKKYNRVKEKLQRAAAAQKKRKAQTENKDKRHMNTIQLLEAKIEELELEAAAAKKQSTFSEEETKLKRRFKELQQRHGEFQRLLLAGQCPADAGSAPLSSSHNPFLMFGPGGASSPGTQQPELSVLRQRLENLESAQQQQLEELGSLDKGDHDLMAQSNL